LFEQNTPLKAPIQCIRWRAFEKEGGRVKSNTIIYNHPADDRVYIVQNHFAGTKILSEVLESMIELSLNQKAANQDDIPKKGRTVNTDYIWIRMFSLHAQGRRVY
jgi:hypothetical protein